MIFEALAGNRVASLKLLNESVRTRIYMHMSLGRGSEINKQCRYDVHHFAGACDLEK